MMFMICLCVLNYLETCSQVGHVKHNFGRYSHDTE